MTNDRFKRLGKCIMLDLVGMASMAIPVIGPAFDIVWAPIAASISYKMFGDKRGKYTSLITFVEEILPMTDFIPSFTIFCVLFDIIGIGKEAEPVSSTAGTAPIDTDYVEVK